VAPEQEAEPRRALGARRRGAVRLEPVEPARRRRQPGHHPGRRRLAQPRRPLHGAPSSATRGCWNTSAPRPCGSSRSSW
jgi:hypothetical protein